MSASGFLGMRALGLALVCCGLAISATASAQVTRAESMFERDRNIGVWQRPRSEYDSGPIQSGALLISPNVNVGIEQNDNIFATSTTEESDTIVVFNPSLNIETTWSRHAVEVNIDLTRREYLDFSDESVWNGIVGVAGRLDVVRDGFLEAGANYSGLTEPRTSAGAAGLAAKPIDYTIGAVFVGGERALGRTRVQGRVDLAEFNYTDAPLFGGGIADQDYRDRTDIMYTIRGDYAVSPDTAIFARVRLNNKNYDLAPPTVPLQRDSDGYTADLGVDFDIGGVARGVLGVGYTEQSYDDAGLADVSGVSVDAQLEWFPSQLTTVTATASRGVEESAIAGSGGFIGTTAALRVDHELRRNWILSGEVRYGEDSYEGIDRTDERFGANLAATWFVNRNVGVRAYYDYSEQNSSGTAGLQDYSRNVVGVSFTIRP